MGIAMAYRKPHEYWLVTPYTNPLKVRNANPYLEGYTVAFEFKDNLLTIEGKAYKVRSLTELQVHIANRLKHLRLQCTELGPNPEPIKFSQIAEFVALSSSKDHASKMVSF